MSDPSYTTTISVDRTPEEVFDAITDVRAWWNAKIQGDADAVGAEFVHAVPGAHYAKIRVTELVPGERITWQVLENSFDFVEDKSEWVGTEIRFELAATRNGSTVRFTHVGLVPAYECFDVCATAWGHYIGNSLRNLATTGSGAPNASPGEERFWQAAHVDT